MADVAQFGIMVTPPENDPQLWLSVQYPNGDQMYYRLCDTSNYEQVARELHKNIMDAGVQARRAKSGLVVVEGNHDATLRQAPRGKPGGKGSPRPQGPRPTPGTQHTQLPRPGSVPQG